MIRNELGRAARSANRPRGSVGASSTRPRRARRRSVRWFSGGYGGPAGQARAPAPEPASPAGRSGGGARQPGARALSRRRPARRAVRPALLRTRPLLRKPRIEAPGETLERFRNLAATRPVATLAGARRRNRNEARAAALEFRRCVFVPAALLASMRLASEARQSSEATAGPPPVIMPALHWLFK